MKLQLTIVTHGFFEMCYKSRNVKITKNEIQWIEKCRTDATRCKRVKRSAAWGNGEKGEPPPLAQ